MSVKLRGSRFDDGSMPISSLTEIQNLGSALKALSEKDKDGDTSTAVAEPHVRFTKGCVVATLYMPPDTGSASQISEYHHNGDLLQRYLSDYLEKRNNDFGSEAVNRAIESIGSSLNDEDELIFDIEDADSSPVTITRQVRNAAVEYYHHQFNLTAPEVDTRAEKDNVTLYGMFTELDADHKKFTFVDRQFGTIDGNYEQLSLTSDIRAVLDQQDTAPITRISCRIKYKRGRPWRIRPLYKCEQIDVGNAEWAKRFSEIVLLRKDWGGNDEPDVAIAALDAARSLLSYISENHYALPGIFPTEDGGVLLEWASTESVSNIEISPEVDFELFRVTENDKQSENSATTNIAGAEAFIKKYVTHQSLVGR